VGLCTATLIPAAVHTVDRLPGLPGETALMAVSWLQRVGGVIAPPLVGIVADTISLRFALAIIPAAAVTATLLASLLTRRGGSAPHPPGR
jgi:fucose permease